ncbi:MAG: YggT family protein [Deltaproteobacteria bacterium]
MFVAGNFVSAVAQVLDLVLNVLSWLIIIRALLSWVNPDPLNPIVQLLQRVTEPVLYPLRKALPFTWRLGFDLSPLLAILGIYFLRLFLVQSLYELSLRLR